MANEEHLAILRKGVEEWNRWRDEPSCPRPDLSDADLRGMNLKEIDFRLTKLERANLEGADLEEAFLGAADMSWANLSGATMRRAILLRSNLGCANLSRAILSSADLTRADAGRANFTGARLSSARFVETNLEGADFTQSKVYSAVFSGIDLSRVQGLETVRHKGPSSIGIDTIYLSKGKVPEVFLRGTGVPEEFIAYMKSLVANPIEFYSCFISYSTKDQEFAERLHGDLQNKNVRCWFAPHDVRGGKKLHEQIDEAIRVHEKVLLILSAESMSSEWVKTEIAKARKREVREKKQVLFPVRLAPFEAIRDWECFDADAGKDSAREIREYFIPDFSEWKDHDKYKKAFERLLVDLKGRTTIGA